MDQIKFLNSLRDWASDLYKDRVPMATRENLAEVQGIIIEDANVRNEFYDIMAKVAKTIIHNKVYSNPLKADFKREEIEYGTIIEELGLDELEAKVYDPVDQNQYQASKPTMSALYNFENRRDLYETKSNFAQLKGAFKGNEGLANFVSAIASKLESSSEIDEFLIMKEMLKSANYCEVNIPELDGTDTKVKNLVQAIRQYVSKMKYPSRDFNELGYLQFTPVEDMRIIMLEEVKNEIDLDYLAKLFHKDLASFQCEMRTVDNFNDDQDTYAIICDKDFLHFYDSLRTSREVENARSLDIFYFLHVWSIVFTTKFLQAVKIRREVEPTSATISKSTLNLSISAQEEATLSITATAPANASYTHYTWTSADENKVKILSQTNTSCKIKVVGGSANDSVVITATNKGTNSVTATCTVTLKA